MKYVIHCDSFQVSTLDELHFNFPNINDLKVKIKLENELGFMLQSSQWSIIARITWVPQLL